MSKPTACFTRCAALALLLATGMAAQADSRIVVQFRSDDGQAVTARGRMTATQEQAAIAQAQSLAARTGLSLRGQHGIAPDTRVLRIAGDAPVAGLLAQLRAQPDVLYAEEDQRMHIAAVPDDPLYATRQWYLQPPDETMPAAIDVESAWDLTVGSASVIVAVLDTGITAHEDLDSKIVAGYDFIAEDAPGDFTTANDGDGRDGNPADPGDSATASSWHGTRVAGIIAAATGNATGIAGIAQQSRILPVRVLGVDGGYTSDIAAGMRWAAGLAVPGAPANANPAQVLNLSLAGDGNCNSTYRSAIAAILEAGVVIVAAAGNETAPVSQPANCAGVLAVAGVRHIGTKVGYSSFGSQVGISAPAGNCVNIADGETCLYPIDTAINPGGSTPSPATNGYTTNINPDGNVGTSFAAPQVAGVAALMLAYNPGLSQDRVIERMKEAARAFPVSDGSLPVCPMVGSGSTQGQCFCTTNTCGAGLLDAVGAVELAARVQAVPVVPDSGRAGTTIDLQGSGSLAAPGETVTGWAWETTCGSIADSDAADTTLTLPDVSGSCTVTLTVTDSAASSETREVEITVSPRASSGKGGGGVIAPASLALLMLLAWRFRRRGKPAG